MGGSLMVKEDASTYSGIQDWQYGKGGGKGVQGYIAQDGLKSAIGDKSAVKEKAKAKEVAKQMMKRSERAQADSAALDAEVEAAMETSVALRGSKGFNFNSAIKVGPF